MALQSASESCKTLQLHSSGIEKLRAALGKRVSSMEPLAAHTSFRVGGPADLFATARSAAELVELARLAREHDVPYFVLGGGTNILVSDRGVRGLVIHNQSRDVKTQFMASPSLPEGNANSSVQCVLEAESGVLLSHLVNYTTRLGLAGLEWAAGIPGTLGGAIVNNAGAFGSAMSDIVQGVSVLDPDGRISIWDAARLAFGYRTSCLKREPNRGHILLSAKLLLRREAMATLQARLAEYATKRREKQPKEASAGSVFMNPPGDHAGRLIEQAGLKGLQVGDAQVSPQHANFIVNLGQAKASEVYTLIEMVRERVYRQANVSLDLEIQLVGDWA